MALGIRWRAATLPLRSAPSRAKLPRGGQAISLFDFTFGLGAVIIGLALTHLASNLHRLALAGNRVRWAAEPILLTLLIFLVIVSVWLFRWDDRHITSTTVGLMLLQVGKLLMPYFAAAFVLPEQVPEEAHIDLLAHYDRTRLFTFGSLIAGLLLFWADRWALRYVANEPVTLGRVIATGPWIFVALYLPMIFVRARWLNIMLLSGALLYYLWEIVPVTLQQ